MIGFIGPLPPNGALAVSFTPICGITDSATGNAMEATTGAGNCVIAYQSLSAQPWSKAASVWGTERAIRYMDCAVIL